MSKSTKLKAPLLIRFLNNDKLKDSSTKNLKKSDRSLNELFDKISILVKEFLTNLKGTTPVIVPDTEWQNNDYSNSIDTFKTRKVLESNQNLFIYFNANSDENDVLNGWRSQVAVTVDKSRKFRQFVQKFGTFSNFTRYIYRKVVNVNVNSMRYYKLLKSVELCKNSKSIREPAGNPELMECIDSQNIQEAQNIHSKCEKWISNNKNTYDKIDINLKETYEDLKSEPNEILSDFFKYENLSIKDLNGIEDINHDESVSSSCLPQTTEYENRKINDVKAKNLPELIEQNKNKINKVDLSKLSCNHIRKEPATSKACSKGNHLENLKNNSKILSCIEAPETPDSVIEKNNGVNTEIFNSNNLSKSDHVVKDFNKIVDSKLGKEEINCENGINLRETDEDATALPEIIYSEISMTKILPRPMEDAKEKANSSEYLSDIDLLKIAECGNEKLSHAHDGIFDYNLVAQSDKMVEHSKNNVNLEFAKEETQELDESAKTGLKRIQSGFFKIEKLIKSSEDSKDIIKIDDSQTSIENVNEKANDINADILESQYFPESTEVINNIVNSEVVNIVEVCLDKATRPTVINLENYDDLNENAKINNPESVTCVNLPGDVKEKGNCSILAELLVAVDKLDKVDFGIDNGNVCKSTEDFDEHAINIKQQTNNVNSILELTNLAKNIEKHTDIEKFESSSQTPTQCIVELSTGDGSDVLKPSNIQGKNKLVSQQRNTAKLEFLKCNVSAKEVQTVFKFDDNSNTKAPTTVVKGAAQQINTVNLDCISQVTSKDLKQNCDVDNVTSFGQNKAIKVDNSKSKNNSQKYDSLHHKYPFLKELRVVLTNDNNLDLMAKSLKAEVNNESNLNLKNDKKRLSSDNIEKDKVVKKLKSADFNTQHEIKPCSVVLTPIKMTKPLLDQLQRFAALSNLCKNLSKPSDNLLNNAREEPNSSPASKKMKFNKTAGNEVVDKPDLLAKNQALKGKIQIAKEKIGLIEPNKLEINSTPLPNMITVEEQGKGKIKINQKNSSPSTSKSHQNKGSQIEKSNGLLSKSVEPGLLKKMVEEANIQNLPPTVEDQSKPKLIIPETYTAPLSHMTIHNQINDATVMEKTVKKTSETSVTDTVTIQKLSCKKITAQSSININRKNSPDNKNVNGLAVLNIKELTKPNAIANETGTSSCVTHISEPIKTHLLNNYTIPKKTNNQSKNEMNHQITLDKKEIVSPSLLNKDTLSVNSGKGANLITDSKIKQKVSPTNPGKKDLISQPAKNKDPLSSEKRVNSHNKLIIHPVNPEKKVVVPNSNNKQVIPSPNSKKMEVISPKFENKEIIGSSVTNNANSTGNALTDSKNGVSDGNWGNPNDGYEFVSHDAAENADNFHLGWNKIRNFNNVGERYRAIRELWRNLAIPNPSRNLTYRHLRGNAAAPTRRHQVITNRRQRSLSCSSIYETMIQKATLNAQISFLELEQSHQQDMFKMSAYFGQLGYCQFPGMSIENHHRSLQELNLIHSEHRWSIQNNLQIEIKNYKDYITEIRTFHSFYQGLDENDNDNKMALTEEQVDLIDDATKTYEAYSKIYRTNRRWF